jgi:Family 4 glycosyl hydrolase C-terminal domain
VWFTPAESEVMSARHVDETIPMLARSDDPYQSNERVRAELMQLTGYFHTESSHHASEYWAWFRKTPDLTRHYLDRHWDNLEVSAAADKARSDQYIVDEARREGIRHGENVTSSSGTPSSRASSSAVFCTLWHRPMTRTPSRSVAQMLGDIGLV